MPNQLLDDPLLSRVPDVDGYKHLPPCLVHHRVGGGGMGNVYHGWHVNLGIEVAVKCLDAGLARRDDKFVQRFQREAQLAARISHQNLIQVYDVDSRHGVHYIVMEFVHGENARERVQRKGALPEDEALRIVYGAACGLGAAHARDIVHRDIKPDNVMIATDGRVKVADLGLAKPLAAAETLSLTQGLMGTPRYMAPEQWTDPDGVGTWTDVWALGATLYFLLTGEDAFRGASANQPFPDLAAKRPGTAPHVLDLLRRCVADRPKDRPRDARALAALLARHIEAEAHDDLADPLASTRVANRPGLVSPPPQTLAKVKTGVDFSPDETEPAGPTPRRDDLAETVPTPARLATPSGIASRPAPPPHRRWPRVVAALAVIAAAGYFGGPPLLAAVLGPEPAPQPIVDEAAVRSALRALAIAPPAGSLVGGRVELRIDAGESGLRAVRWTGGEADAQDGEVRLPLTFTTDGEAEASLALVHRSGIEETVRWTCTVDATAPSLAVDSPAEGALVPGAFELRGTVTDDHAVTVRCGDAETTAAGGSWTLRLQAPDGERTFEVVAVDAAGNAATVRRTVAVDTLRPELRVDELPTETEAELVTVSGATEAGARVDVDGEAVPVAEDGSFRTALALDVGEHTVVITATDAAGNVSTSERRLRRVTPAPLPPALELGTDGELAWRAIVELRGRTEPAATVTAGGARTTAADDGSFALLVPLPTLAAAAWTVRAVGASGAAAEQPIRVAAPPSVRLVLDAPADGERFVDGETVRVRGRVTPADARVEVAGRALAVAADGTIDAPVQPADDDTVRAVAYPDGGAPDPGCLLRLDGDALRVAAVSTPDVGVAVGDRIERVDDAGPEVQAMLRRLASASRAVTLQLAGGERRQLAIAPGPRTAVVRRLERVPRALTPLTGLLGVTPGVTTRAEVAKLGVRDPANPDYFTIGSAEVAIDPRRDVAERVLLRMDDQPLPPPLADRGFAWRDGFAECRQRAGDQRWPLRNERQPVGDVRGWLEYEPARGLRLQLLFDGGRLTRVELVARR